MHRSLLLSALLALALVFATVATGCSADSEAARALERSLEKSRTLGSRMTMSGTFGTGAQTTRMTARATVEAGGRRMRMNATIDDLEMEQFLEGSQMLMSADAFPATGAFPPGTRWLRFDLDELLKSSGLDTSMRELQQLDPTKAMVMLQDAELEKAGSGTVRGVAVDRYRATISLEDIAKQLGGKSEIPEAFKDGKMSMTLALDNDDLLRAFDMSGDLGGERMSMKFEITSYGRDIRVEVPSGEGIYDMSQALNGLGDPS